MKVHVKSHQWSTLIAIISLLFLLAAGQGTHAKTSLVVVKERISARIIGDRLTITVPVDEGRLLPFVGHI